MDINAGKKLKFFNKMNCSNLKKKASQVHKIHKAKSVVRAIVLLE